MCVPSSFVERCEGMFRLDHYRLLCGVGMERGMDVKNVKGSLILDGRNIKMSSLFRSDFCVRDKVSVIRLLESAGVPVVSVAPPSSPPLDIVVKPRVGLGGIGVVSNVTSLSSSILLCQKIQTKSPCYAEVKQRGMRHYRVVSLNDRHFFVYGKAPRVLEGDGQRSIRSLLLANPCSLEEWTTRTLSRKDVPWKKVLGRGETFQVSIIDNAHACGVFREVTNPLSVSLASRMASSVSASLFPGLVPHLYSIDYWAETDTSDPIVGEVNCANTGIHTSAHSCPHYPYRTILIALLNATPPVHKKRK